MQEGGEGGEGLSPLRLPTPPARTGPRPPPPHAPPHPLSHTRTHAQRCELRFPAASGTAAARRHTVLARPGTAQDGALVESAYQRYKVRRKWGGAAAPARVLCARVRVRECAWCMARWTRGLRPPCPRGSCALGCWLTPPPTHTPHTPTQNPSRTSASASAACTPSPRRPSARSRRVSLALPRLCACAACPCGVRWPLDPRTPDTHPAPTHPPIPHPPTQPLGKELPELALTSILPKTEGQEGEVVYAGQVRKPLPPFLLPFLLPASPSPLCSTSRLNPPLHSTCPLPPLPAPSRPPPRAEGGPRCSVGGPEAHDRQRADSGAHRPPAPPA